MTQRIDHLKLVPTLTQKLTELTFAVQKGPLDHTILGLVEIRASQLNGCAFCLDMHIKQAKIHGERELRLHHVAIWRESNLFNDRERAALEWTEALTKLSAHGVPDEIYDTVRAEFSEEETVYLTYMIMVINAWNRASIAFQSVPGSQDKAFGLDKANLS